MARRPYTRSGTSHGGQFQYKEVYFKDPQDAEHYFKQGKFHGYDLAYVVETDDYTKKKKGSPKGYRNVSDYNDISWYITGFDFSKFQQTGKNWRLIVHASRSTT